MGAFSDLHYFKCLEQNDFSINESKQFYTVLNFRKKYDLKKYDKLDLIYLNIKKWKLVISESYYQKIKSDKVLIELFVILKTNRNKNITFDFLHKLGFKKTTLKLVINKMISLGLINKEQFNIYKTLKLNKINLTKNKEKRWTLKGENTWKLFLLYGLKTAIVYSIIERKSKKITAANCVKNTNIKKVILQNSYFSVLGLNSNEIYKAIKNICCYFQIKYKQLFYIERALVDTLTHEHKNNQLFKVPWDLQYQFITKRYLIMRF